MLFHRCQIQTSLDPRGINERLRAQCTAMDWLGRPKTDGTLTGKLFETSFRLKHLTRGRDFFNPAMYGRYQAAGSGTTVRVLMTLHPLVWVMLAFATYSFFDSAIASVRAKGALDPMPVLLLVFVWGMTIVFFKQNVRRNEALLREYLSGRPSKAERKARSTRG